MHQADAFLHLTVCQTSINQPLSVYKGIKSLYGSVLVSFKCLYSFGPPAGTNEMKNNLTDDGIHDSLSWLR